MKEKGVSLGIIEGGLPSRALRFVVEWAQDHKEELLRNWNSLKSSGSFEKIEPLV